VGKRGRGRTFFTVETSGPGVADGTFEEFLEGYCERHGSCPRVAGSNYPRGEGRVSRNRDISQY